MMIVDVIIPARDEENGVGNVVRGCLDSGMVRDIWVVDNGSRDATAARAMAAGASVVAEPQRGYGHACLKGIASLRPGCEVVVFVDADESDDPRDLPCLLEAVSAGADLVIGSRVLGVSEPGALTPQQRIGNKLASVWLAARFGLPATDLGPFRAVRKSVLDGMRMTDVSYGWTVEMQIKAAQQRLRYVEVPVSYRRRRAGSSKVSGTLRGVAGATAKILGLLALYDIGDRLPVTRPLLRKVARL